MFEQPIRSLAVWALKRAGINQSAVNSSSWQYLVNKPAWLSLSNPHEYRKAVAENPVLNGCISILAEASANGRKYLVDLDGKIIPWSSRMAGVRNARKLFVDRPNPLQSVKEFCYERKFMFYTYGNNYVYLNNPLESFDTDISNVQSMINLPSEFVTVRKTGKIYDQVDITGIIEMYSLINYNPPKEFDPTRVIHFNDINLSEIGTSVIGTSRLENLKWPIQNTQLAFEAMNVILESRGMQGIIKANNKDAQGTQITLSPEAKKEIQDTFKNDYGTRKGQSQYLISYSDIEYIKTLMNSKELGIYEEFSNNAMIISNGFNIPPELYKTYMAGATFENQVQAERRLYQNNVIPNTDNEDKYFTERLKMHDYGFELKTDFSHVSCLQEAFKERATALYYSARAADMAYNNNAINWNEYRGLLQVDDIDGENGKKFKFERPETLVNPDASPKVDPIVEPAPIALP